MTQPKDTLMKELLQIVQQQGPESLRSLLQTVCQAILEAEMTQVLQAQRIAQGLDKKSEGFEYTIVFESKTGSVELFRIDKGVKLHHHPKENHILYILKGRGKGQVGNVTAEVGPGQIVVIPAGVKHKLERIGAEPLDFILFSTPPFVAGDIVWDE